MTTNTWDAASYDTDFSVISRLGRGVVDLLDPQPGERVLDVGCGTAELTAQIAGRGATVVGVDADPSMVARARQLHPEIDVREADAQALPPDLADFDAAFSSAALHWMPRQRDVLQGVAGALRPGGRFVGELGTEGNVAMIEAALRRARDEAGLDPDLPGPWTFPSPGHWASLLEATGFTVGSLVRFERPTPLEQPSLTDWLRVFAGPLVADVTADQLAELGERVDDLCRAALWRDGHWWADYVRLRFTAVRR